MKIWLIQSVLSPYRIPLFQRIAETNGVDFRLILLSDKFKTRPQWKRDLSALPFKVEVPFGFGYQTGPEHEYCINPFLLWKMIRDRPDVIICGGYSFATLSALIYQRLFGNRYVIWTEATILSDGRIKGWRLWLRRVMIRSASAILDAGTLARDYVRSLVPEFPDNKLFRAYNCVNNPHFKKSAEEAEKARRFLTAQDLPEHNLLFVGKLNERKGVPQLLEVYRRIVAMADLPVGLILVGEGELRSQAEHFKREHGLKHLRLEGWVTNEETAKYYWLSGAFVLLSKVDHNPLVLFEALASGIPIICSQGACNAIDFIQNGRNGYIVDPDAIDEVVARTLEVMRWDANRRQECERYSFHSVRKANYEDAAEAFITACTQAAQPHFGKAIDHRVCTDELPCETTGGSTKARK